VNYPALLRSAFVALLRNKMRSLLTILGITIGIAAVICVVAIGKAGHAECSSSSFVWIEAGGRAVNGVRTGTHDTKTLVESGAVAIKNQVSLIKNVSPNVDDPIQVVYGNQNWHTVYRGVAPDFFEIKRWYLDQGVIFSQDDVDRASDVCIVGRTVRGQLFGVEDPVGKVIRVNNLPCKVVATLQPKRLSLSGQDQDDVIILPYTTAQPRPWPWSAFRNAGITFPPKCLVSNSNAWRLRGHWSTDLRFCWQTNRQETSTAGPRSRSWKSFSS
jgi:putative ABC transport system permease protein